MASGSNPCPEHETPTRRGKRYCFYDKHHDRRGITEPAQWDPGLSPDEEFAIFDEADWHEISDEGGNLYGMRRAPNNEILNLGAGGEQVAKFWIRHRTIVYHGFPLLPLAEGSRPSRKEPPPRVALKEMARIGWLTPTQLKRLLKGGRA